MDIDIAATLLLLKVGLGPGIGHHLLIAAFPEPARIMDRQQHWPPSFNSSISWPHPNVNRHNNYGHRDFVIANVNRQQIVRARTRVYIYPLYAAIILIRGNKICSLVRCNNL